jgi:hypothetical protein
VARISEEWATETAVIVVKPLQWGNDSFYKVGDEFLPPAEHRTRALKLAEHGWFLPRSEWNMQKQNDALRDIRNKAQPFAARIDRYERELIGAKAEYAAAQAMVKKAKDDITTLEYQKQHAVKELGDILSGAKVV